MSYKCFHLLPPLTAAAGPLVRTKAGGREAVCLISKPNWSYFANLNEEFIYINNNNNNGAASGFSLFMLQLLLFFCFCFSNKRKSGRALEQSEFSLSSDLHWCSESKPLKKKSGFNDTHIQELYWTHVTIKHIFPSLPKNTQQTLRSCGEQWVNWSWIGKAR